MPNGQDFDNPYLTEIQGWLDVINPGWGGSMTEAGLDYNPEEGTVADVYYDEDIFNQPLGYEVPIYQYSGMSPEIMSALSGVFTFPQTSGDWNPFGSLNPTTQDELIAGGIQELLGLGIGAGAPITSALTPDMTEEGLSAQIFNIDPVTGLPLDETGELLDVMIGQEDLYSMLPFVNVFDEHSIASALGVQPGTVPALSIEKLAKTKNPYYEPYETSKREELIKKKDVAQAKVPTGGFAGSGAREAGKSAAEKVYDKGYEDLYATIMKMQAEAQSDIIDQIYGWGEQIT